MRAWLVWGVGVLAYAVAVFDRSSLGVAGILAQQRFDASAATLSLFVVLQIAVYASLQVPVGLLLDRLGSRRAIILGAAALGAGQLALAVAHTVPAAVAARVLVGAGDALTFISVLRLVPVWFPARSVPVVTQLTGILGQTGQIAAALPLVALLSTVGWTPAYAGTAAVSVLVIVLVAATVRDAPPGVEIESPVGWTQVRAALRDAWREPGTRLGLWAHFASPFSAIAFALLWGYPFLVTAQGLNPPAAGTLLSIMVVVSIVVGPVFGALVGYWPLRRSALVLLIVASSAMAWAAVLAWPGPAPLPLLVLLVVVLAAGGPASMVGFDFARTMNPASRLGSATGIVNVGGWMSTLITVLAVGVVLDVVSAGDPAAYTPADFRAAFAVQYLLWAIGVVGIVRTRRILRRRLAEQEGIVVEPLPRALLRRLRR
jgi:MFS family permease